jgi:hypothetical protein
LLPVVITFVLAGRLFLVPLPQALILLVFLPPLSLALVATLVYLLIMSPSMRIYQG